MPNPRHTLTERELERLLDESYQRGYADAESELLPFGDVADVVFDRTLPQFAAVVKYERELLAALHNEQHLHTLAQGHAERARQVVDELADEQPAHVKRAAAAGKTRVGRFVRRQAAALDARVMRDRAAAQLVEDGRRAKAGVEVALELCALAPGC